MKRATAAPAAPKRLYSANDNPAGGHFLSRVELAS